MVFKKKKYTPQEFIQMGMGLFLLGVFFSMVADGRLIGAFFANLIQNKSTMEIIKGVAAGLSVPAIGGSIFFNLRGLWLFRCQK
jgi:hypothetical protein